MTQTAQLTQKAGVGRTSGTVTLPVAGYADKDDQRGLIPPGGKWTAAADLPPAAVA
jgi:hypothetical protein